MSIKRIVCGQCGLAATHIQTGDRAATSFDSEEALRCAAGKAAKEAGEPIAARVLACAHLSEALQRQDTPPAR